MIIMMIMIMTMTTVCFFCQSNCVQNPCKNNATCQSGFATIPKVHTIAHAKMDSREMDENVKVSVGFISDYARKR